MLQSPYPLPKKARSLLIEGPFLRCQFLNYLLALGSEQQLPGVEWPSKQEEGGQGATRSARKWCLREPPLYYVWELETLIAIHSDFSLREPLR